MKKVLFFFIACVASISLKAQNSYNYAKFGIGINASQVRPYADLNIKRDNYAFALIGYYNLTPYVPIGLELQFGTLAAGSIELDPHKREFKNNYKAILLHGDLQLGEIIDYSNSAIFAFLKDFYIGTGAGVIMNNMSFLQRTNLKPDAQYAVGQYRFPGEDKSMNLVVPVRVGYELKLFNDYDEPYMGITIGYNHSFTWGEGLDGYTDPPSGFKNNSLDQYRQIVVGVKMNFGSSVSHYKNIRY